MLLNHHILAKKATDSVLAKFKNGDWKCCGEYGKGFFRAGCDADFPSPDATFGDLDDDLVVSFEFKPPTETKRGILTGLGQSIAYLQFSDLAYLVIPERVEDYDISGHLADIFTSIIADKIPVGLISYRNDNPEDVTLAHNVTHRLMHDVKHANVQNRRFWAKHVDMPIPLFHLILHYAYLHKVNNDQGDAFARCWTSEMAPKENLLKLAPRPVRDVNGQIIMTVAKKKPLTYYEKTVAKIKRLSGDERTRAIADMVATADTHSTGDNMFNSVRKNCLPFMHHVGMLDSNCQLTGEGVKMYHLGMVNGPQSSLFRDYFTRMVLLDGHHIDLIYDLERLSCDCRGRRDTAEIKAIMLDEYAAKGMIKTNPGRCVVGTRSTEVSRFLKYEMILWRSLGLLKKTAGLPSFAFDWQRITEVCNLPNL